LADLGLGCLFTGGGASMAPGSRVPENASSIFDSPDGGATLVASAGTGPRDCTILPSATAPHCLHATAQTCTSDADCDGVFGACAFDASCYFGAPMAVDGAPKTCVVNTQWALGPGMANLATGELRLNLFIVSDVYLSPSTSAACPQCIDG